VYGAIGTAGEWGLKRGCAVAYADKGSGNGVHDLATDTVNLIDGTRATSTAACPRRSRSSACGRNRSDAVKRAARCFGPTPPLS
jgi:hydroxybutyrate-dimer hydrolase